MTTLLPVAVAITTSGLPPPPRPVLLQRGERFLLIWTQLEHWPISGRRLPERRRPGPFPTTSVAHATERGPLGPLRLPLLGSPRRRGGRPGRLFRFRRLCFQRQDAARSGFCPG